MIFYPKSSPEPTSLQSEKLKKSGRYNCDDVLERLKSDFKNKCYICGHKAPTVINVEHLRPHKGNVHLKFAWNNLFWSCGHCNTTKLGKYENIIDCTDPSANIEYRVRIYINPYPKELVQVTPLDSTLETLETSELLSAVYNGTSPQKKMESSNLRELIKNELINFRDQTIIFYDDDSSLDEKNRALKKIKFHLSSASNFTEFKRWIVRENEVMKNDLEKYFI